MCSRVSRVSLLASIRCKIPFEGENTRARFGRKDGHLAAARRAPNTVLAPPHLTFRKTVNGDDHEHHRKTTKTAQEGLFGCPYLEGGTHSDDGKEKLREENETREPLLRSPRRHDAGTTGSTRKSNLDGYKLTPLVERSILMRYDVGLFFILYSICLWIDFQYNHNNSSTSEQAALAFEEWARRLALPLVLLLHVSVALWRQWNVNFQCFVGYQRAQQKGLETWTHCLVESPRVGGARHAAIVETRRDTDGAVVVSFHDIVFRAGGQDEIGTLWTQQNDRSPVISSDNNRTSSFNCQFHKLRYPIQLSLSFYSRWTGHATLESVKQSQSLYGSNTTHIQLPPFTHLLGQQLVAPFFLFQLFCVLLWSLDEYWYYALFTLFALVMFESTVAYNRLQGLERLRGTLRHAYPLYVYRHKTWMKIMTEELVPGDIVSLSARPIYTAGSRQLTQPHVPADILLVQGGSAVVDEALLTGESIPQLKVPLTADAASNADERKTSLDVESEHKSSVLFGGTVLVSQDDTSDETDSTTAQELETAIPPPPDKGLVGFTLRTGFDTAQGSLLRTMAHSSHKAADGIHTEDTFVFVAMLLCCAIGSALMVLQEGWYDETRNRFRLVLHVIIIVTSVVPPELPMELSLAVTNSVADLMKRCHVYCTEPFRIPWAGQVDVCCFDKTGTLTSDEMQLQGVVRWNNDGSTELIRPSSDDKIPWSTLRVMAACHSLAVAPGRRMSAAADDNLIGNPLERAVLRDTGYRLQTSNTVVACSDDIEGQPKSIQIHHRFAFSSRLKRMTTLVTEDSSDIVWALTKGAPETIKTFLDADSIPSDYDDVYTHHMGRGQRVLTMGYRHCVGKTVSSLKEEGRDKIEQDLTFAGFLILDCPLKPDSKTVVTELRKSGHDVVMITGDAVLTAAEVARQVGIVHKKAIAYELSERDRDGDELDDPLKAFNFVPMPATRQGDRPKDISLSMAALPFLKEMLENREASFCVSGSTLSKVALNAVRAYQQGSLKLSDNESLGDKNAMLHSAAQSVLKDLVPIVSVFARHAPHQKEAVVAAFNLGDRHTLMCGDGTNDVGALKRAHVGISIISAPELEAKQRKATEALSDLKAEEKRERKDRKEGRKKSSSKKRVTTFEATLRDLQEAQDELDHVELGDASVASPFTSRAMSIKCCKDVLQQGRCTLVTMLQIYKILGVNCLVNALVLTKLHMHGVKQGDRQLTILGVAVAALFFFVTRGKPLPTLSPHRPPSSVLCKQALLSVAAQSFVHFVVIMLATEASLAFVDPYDPSMTPDAAFNPNVLNTCTFLLTMTATVCTFVVNYRGRPYVEDFRNNKMLLRSVQVCFGALLVCAFEAFPPLNDILQLSPFPDVKHVSGDGNVDDDWVVNISEAGGLTGFVRTIGFQYAMAFLIVLDVTMAYLCEKIIVRIFEG
jgi:cation-transporting ATPase 13A1